MLAVQNAVQSMVTAPTALGAAAQPGPAPAAITIAHGDGIGPEIMQATLFVLREAGANLQLEPIEIGERVYRQGISAGILPSAWESLRRTRVFLKAPITTPQGGGYKSLNVTVRKALGLFANVRPCMAYAPFVQTKNPGMNVVIVRENEEDLYAGIEHRQTDEVMQCLKLITRPGCEKIVRYAFEYAQRAGRKKVSCFTKDNIMKMTDGLFHQVFDEIGSEYPQLEKDHWIVDIGAAKLADQPELFDVVVMPNLYGDILSDVAAEVAGSVGLAGSANIGDGCAMFEAIHGSAPTIAGQDVANPSGLLLASVMMMVHIGQQDVAERVHNAWLRTIEDGVHTRDVYCADISRQCVGTQAFASAVVHRLGQRPQHLTAASYPAGSGPMPPSTPRPTQPARKELVGVDIFLHWKCGTPDDLGQQLERLQTARLKLQMVTNRGIKVYPNGLPETFCTDHWRCRFMGDRPISHADVITLLDQLQHAGLDFIKTEHLCTFDGKPGFSLGQGQ